MPPSPGAFIAASIEQPVIEKILTSAVCLPQTPLGMRTFHRRRQVDGMPIADVRVWGESMSTHVFLVDDEEDFLLSTNLLLGLEGFQVTFTASSVDAVARVRDGQVDPDVVLLDHRMPVLTGPAALAQMRAAGMQAAAVLVSAMRDIESVAQAHGFDAHLAKPFSVSQLLQRIDQAISARRAR